MKLRRAWQVGWLLLLSFDAETREIRHVSNDSEVCEGDAPELMQHQALQAPKKADLTIDVVGNGAPEKDLTVDIVGKAPAAEKENTVDVVGNGPAQEKDFVVDVVGNGHDFMGQKVDSCQAESWPCYDNVACHWPLQQINTRSGCSDGTGYANISSLNLEDGTYTTICQIEGVCLNACSVSPIHSAIYCRAQGTFEGQQFVRISCPLGDLSNLPVKGSLCYYGTIESTFAGSFDLEYGIYYWKTQDGNDGVINKLEAEVISNFEGSTTALVANTTGWDQVKNKTIEVVRQRSLKRIADFVIAAGDLIPGGLDTDRFLVGCHGNRVYVQNVNFTGSAPRTQSYLMVGAGPDGSSGAQWFFKGEVYCAYNLKAYGVYYINISAIDDEKDTIPAGYVSASQETNSNDGMNCLNASSPFPPAVITTTPTTTTTSTTTTTTTTTVSKVRCPHGQADFTFADVTPGSWQVGSELAPGVTLADFKAGDVSGCTNAAVLTPDNAANGTNEENLKTCNCSMLVAQADGPNDTVTVCDPTTSRVSIVLQFDLPQQIRGFEMWNNCQEGLLSNIRWQNENRFDFGEKTVQITSCGTSTGFIDISKTQPLPLNVMQLSLDLADPAGLKSIRFCKHDGSVVGDPHVHTLDGQNYILLRQGSFLMWRFSDFKTEFPSANLLDDMVKAEVDWRIFAHYSGHQAFTKALLLQDYSIDQRKRQAIELTSEKCEWRKKRNRDDSWTPLDQPNQMLSVPTPGGEFVTGFNVTWDDSDKDIAKHVRLVMNTKRGTRVIASIHVSCRPGHHINARVEMDQMGYARNIQGEVGQARRQRRLGGPPTKEVQDDLVAHADLLGAAQSQERRTDDQFRFNTQWIELGGSSLAAEYLATVDEEDVVPLKPCNEEEEAEAREICAKHFEGPQNDFFTDCVFDVCAGGGEISAMLLAAIA